MTLNAYKFGLASAISFSVIWLVCSLLVWLFPKMTMGIAGEMLHADMTSLGWQISSTGVVTGLIGWAVTAGVIGWFLVVIYNKL
ncbi:DUF5676 family membrane protein [Cycloclasticus zancles]|jgi:hypothetical protein|uniref:Uncharacterized protein n=1 Tax=Cycloclasticus zancles 78-ME TaxID=1198232 RepID=S5T771_9GAMM|nr:DUF5676 family membrane protein [Cycloclasticus zancles]AGS39631.1 hypothetical protein CYCME_1302 [Cycloclasticus zancles 78-ME]